jgi:hypothetical protein
MKTKTLLLTALLGCGLLTAMKVAESPNPEILAIGTKAPLADLKMESANGLQISLNDIKDQNGLLVIFSCNTCPFVVGNGEKTEGWEGRYLEYHMAAVSNQIGTVLVNSNEAKRDAGDSMDDMRAHAREKAYRMNYVLDKNHQLADAFGARTTPHVFLFDKDMTLVYKGAPDDNVDRASEVKEPYLLNAIKNLAAGKKIDPESTKQVGCSIKRVG